jgi:hemoglobin
MIRLFQNSLYRFCRARPGRIIARSLVLFAAGISIALAQQGGGPGSGAQERTLYQRLGGYDTIAAIVDEVGSRLGVDDQLRRFFRGHSKDSLARQRQLALDLLCDLTGGPCIYIGRDLKTTHGGLGISPSDWARATALIDESLGRFNLPERERRDFLTLIATLQKDIVEQ